MVQAVILQLGRNVLGQTVHELTINDTEPFTSKSRPCGFSTTTLLGRFDPERMRMARFMNTISHEPSGILLQQIVAIAVPKHFKCSAFMLAFTESMP